MPNVIEALISLLKPQVDEESKVPLHVGEVMALWTYQALLDEAAVYEEVALNTTEDHDLRGSVKDAIEMCIGQSNRLRDFLRSEGVPLPPVTEPKPASDPTMVPLGAKLTDNEIANGISVKVVSAITLCASGAAQSVRNDVGALWLRFQSEQMLFGVTLKQLMKKRGWLKIPPYYRPPGAPQHHGDDGGRKLGLR